MRAAGEVCQYEIALGDRAYESDQSAMTQAPSVVPTEAERSEA